MRVAASLCKRGVVQSLQVAPKVLRDAVPTEAAAINNPRRMLRVWTREKACQYGQGRVYDLSAGAFLTSGFSATGPDVNIARRLELEYSPAELQRLAGEAPQTGSGGADAGGASGGAGEDAPPEDKEMGIEKPTFLEALLGEDTLVSPLAVAVGVIVVVITIGGILIFVRSR